MKVTEITIKRIDNIFEVNFKTDSQISQSVNILETNPRFENINAGFEAMEQNLFGVPAKPVHENESKLLSELNVNKSEELEEKRSPKLGRHIKTRGRRKPK